LLRLFSLYRTASAPAAIALLIASNLVPLVGVLFWGWNLWSILVLYWIENGIVGLLNIPKMLLARGGGEPGESGSAGRLFLTAFFCVHYGIFWLGHGVFVLLFLPAIAGFSSAVESGATFTPGGLGLPGVFTDPVVTTGPRADVLLWGALGLLVSHVASFFLNYISRREYLTRSAAGQMFAPYARVVVLHLTIIFGGIVTVFLGQPIGALVVLVALKTILDLALHLREHDPQARPTRIEEAGRPG
jgi:hypothetical protein